MAAVLMVADGDEKYFDVAICESGVSVENGISKLIYTITVGNPEPNEKELFNNLLTYFFPVTKITDGTGKWYGSSPLKPTTTVLADSPNKVLPEPFNALAPEDLKMGKVLALYRDGSMRFYFQEGEVNLSDLETLLAKMGRAHKLKVSRKLKTFF